MNWELILQTVVPMGALMAWIYSRLDKRFDKIDQRFDKVDAQLNDLNTRLSRIEGSMWGGDHRKCGNDQH